MDLVPACDAVDRRGDRDRRSGFVECVGAERPADQGRGSLALTGAGAAPSKVISTALEMWRDDVNAKEAYSAGRSSSSFTMIRARRRTSRPSTPS